MLYTASVPVPFEEEKAEGEFGGNSATPERIQKRTAPAVLLITEQNTTKFFFFPLEEKSLAINQIVAFKNWRGFQAATI
ncbi:MAG: hypothetical protein IPL87_04640 [Candidatus Moraniibacteriota bacterium]|nr:MAG: hypothetical protein IPL87_04640 [Candidatus Moranbacteria bacterium]